MHPTPDRRDWRQWLQITGLAERIPLKSGQLFDMLVRMTDDGHANASPAADLRNQVQEAVNTLLNRQGADGAIGLWRTGDALSSPWLGAYATDFLFRAKAAGYVVPDAALDKALATAIDYVRAIKNCPGGDKASEPRKLEDQLNLAKVALK